VAPPGNQAANGENKLQPVAMGGSGLLDNHLLPESNTIKHNRRDLQQYIHITLLRKKWKKLK
jgi:hypothetical protein